MANTLKITTDNRRRPLLSWQDLPEEQRDWFDYVTSDEIHDLRFVKFRGNFYDVQDVESTRSLSTTPTELERRGWQGYLAELYFAGVAFRWFDRDGELLEGEVVCANWSTID